MSKIKKWSHKDQVLFFETLSDLIQSGYPMREALESMMVVLPNRKNDLNCIRGALAEGQTFEEGILGYVDRTIQFQLSFVKLHGDLGAVIYEIGAHEYERNAQLQKMRSLMLYPACLLLLTIVFGTMLGSFLQTSSKVDQTFLSDGATRVIGSILGIVLIVGGQCLWRWYNHISTLKRWLFWLKVPIVNRLMKLTIGYYVSFHMGILLQSGVGIAEVVKNLTQLKPGRFLSEIGSAMMEHMQQGGDLIDYLQAMPLLPTEAQILFSTGKSQLEIGKDLERLARVKKNQLDKTIERLLLLLQPLCFAVIGIVIVSLYLNYLLPIYSEIGDLEI